MRPVIFYFDIGSPYAYLAAERVSSVLPAQVKWQPVLLGGLFKLARRSSWALGDHVRRQRGMEEIERRALGYGLPPLRWPDPWPADYLTAMRAATFAFAAGSGHAFVMQAFRDAFQRGKQLELTEQVLDVAEHVGLAREEVRAAIADPEVKQALRDATERAHSLGVFGVPTIAVGDELFWGDDRLEDVAARLAAPQRSPDSELR